MSTIGDYNNDELRSLDSLIAFTASVENSSTASSSSLSLDNKVVVYNSNNNTSSLPSLPPFFQPQQQQQRRVSSDHNLVLTNRVIVYNNMAQCWFGRRHYEEALWAIDHAIMIMKQLYANDASSFFKNTMSILLSNKTRIHSTMGDLNVALQSCIEAYGTSTTQDDDDDLLFRASLLFDLGRLLVLTLNDDNHEPIDRPQLVDQAEYALKCSLELLLMTTSTTSDDDDDVELETRRERDIVTIQSYLLLLQEQQSRMEQQDGNDDDDDQVTVIIGLLKQLIRQRSDIGYENESVALTLFQLGEVYMNQGQQQQREHASMFLTEAVRVQKHIGASDEDLLLTLSKLGHCLQAGDNHREALAHYRQALRLKVHSIYEEPPHVQVIFATILYNVGMIHSLHDDNDDPDDDTTRSSRALQSFRICLDLRTTAMGRMHPDVASVMHNIAFLLLQRGDSTESLKLFRESLEIRWKTLGPTHFEVASSLRHIGRIHQDRGQYDLSLQLHTRALSILRTSTPERSDDVVEVLMGLGQAQHSMGYFAQALRSYQDALSLLRHCRQMGKKGSSQHIAHVLSIMGSLALDMANVEAANAYFAEAAMLSSETTTSSGRPAVEDMTPVCAAAA